MNLFYLFPNLSNNLPIQTHSQLNLVTYIPHTDFNSINEYSDPIKSRSDVKRRN